MGDYTYRLGPREAFLSPRDDVAERLSLDVRAHSKAAALVANKRIAPLKDTRKIAFVVKEYACAILKEFSKISMLKELEQRATTIWTSDEVALGSTICRALDRLRNSITFNLLPGFK